MRRGGQGESEEEEEEEEAHRGVSAEQSQGGVGLKFGPSPAVQIL